MRTIAKITAMLVEHRALAVLTEYNSDREPRAVSFRIQTERWADCLPASGTHRTGGQDSFLAASQNQCPFLALGCPR